MSEIELCKFWPEVKSCWECFCLFPQTSLVSHLNRDFCSEKCRDKYVVKFKPTEALTRIVLPKFW